MGKVKTAVICAAGLGSRLGLNIPKCLVPLKDKKIMYYLLELLKEVDDLRIVVGFKEQEVIDYVRQFRKDVIFVRNPNYHSTTNAYSLHLATHDLETPFLTVDGDMIIDPNSFMQFIHSINKGEDVIGVVKATTEDAVFVSFQNDKVTGFSRDRIGNFEWSGIGYFSNIKIRKEGKYVYQELEDHLPIRGIEVNCFEVDTPSDLDYAMNNIDFL